MSSLLSMSLANPDKSLGFRFANSAVEIEFEGTMASALIKYAMCYERSKSLWVWFEQISLSSLSS